MDHEQLYFSEYKRFLPDIEESYLPFPFYTTHSEAREQFMQSVAQGKGQGFVLYHDKAPAVFLVIHQETIVNLLLKREANLHLKQIIGEIEKIYKALFKKYVFFRFQTTLSLPIEEQFIKFGYLCEAPKTLQKKLSYNTALVLGGGGARGAYQIGVWQALQELAIDYPLIIGTSVGALNGALILQGDLEAAKKMWEKIETSQILAFSTVEEAEKTFIGMVGQVGAFARQALQSNGISTQPLQKLIKETFSEVKMRQNKQELYVVTTALPQLEEVVVTFDECESKEWSSWLLASASFFPAMAATKIKEQYYVDGGYRNNVPVDVALAHGATECIVIDVKGPGITKGIKIPETITTVTLQTPWSMGSILLFDGLRSTQNMQLGYMETMKAFGCYRGFWYTIDTTDAEIFTFQKEFHAFLVERYAITQLNSFSHSQKICKKLQKIYKNKVYPEIIAQVLLELLAKNADISATTLYSLNELSEKIRNSKVEEPTVVTSTGLVSVQEWLKLYYEDYFLLSEKQQIQGIANLLKINEIEKKQRILFLMDKLPVQTLHVLMNEFIQQGANE
ncbi:patatin-like phospholipase family protein [Enterococcus sp. LJL99]